MSDLTETNRLLAEILAELKKMNERAEQPPEIVLDEILGQTMNAVSKMAKGGQKHGQ